MVMIAGWWWHFKFLAAQKDRKSTFLWQILQESDKGQIFYWSIQTCTRIRLLFDRSIAIMLKKPQNCPISDFFDLTPKYFLPLLPYTDLVPPSTDPVPPSTNQYRPKLTQCHHVSTITALYWSSTSPILTQYHQVSTSTAFYWTSTIIYQPVPHHTDPVPPSVNQYQPILLLHGDYRLLHSLPWVFFS